MARLENVPNTAGVHHYRCAQLGPIESCPSLNIEDGYVYYITAAILFRLSTISFPEIESSITDSK